MELEGGLEVQARSGAHPPALATRPRSLANPEAAWLEGDRTPARGFPRIVWALWADPSMGRPASRVTRSRASRPSADEGQQELPVGSSLGMEFHLRPDSRLHLHQERELLFGEGRPSRVDESLAPAAAGQHRQRSRTRVKL